MSCRLNGQDMLGLLRDKRLVFVGDSLNRNMWESLVCVLRNSLEDASRVFEASGRREYRTEGSYSFIFKVGCSESIHFGLDFITCCRLLILIAGWLLGEKNGKIKIKLLLLF